MKKRKYQGQKKRTPEELKRLSKRLVKYYFENPHANGLKYMRDKFKVHETFIRKSISAELERRFTKAREVRNL